MWVSFPSIPNRYGALYNSNDHRWVAVEKTVDRKIPARQPKGDLMIQDISDLLSTIIEAFNYSKDGIAIVTIEGTLLYYNRVWVEIHALDPKID